MPLARALKKRESAHNTDSQGGSQEKIGSWFSFKSLLTSEAERPPPWPSPSAGGGKICSLSPGGRGLG